jgi:hypothetical protein
MKTRLTFASDTVRDSAFGATAPKDDGCVRWEAEVTLTADDDSGTCPVRVLFLRENANKPAAMVKHWLERDDSFLVHRQKGEKTVKVIVCDAVRQSADGGMIRVCQRQARGEAPKPHGEEPRSSSQRAQPVCKERERSPTPRERDQQPPVAPGPMAAHPPGIQPVMLAL